MTPLKGQIYYCKMEETTENEMENLIPVVIVQNNVGNYQKPTTIVAPILKEGVMRFLLSYVTLSPEVQKIDEGFKEVEGTICADKVRTIDKVRLRNLVGCLNREGIEKLDKALVSTLELTKDRKPGNTMLKGEIYYCSLDEDAVGYEMNKLRPVVIVKTGNHLSSTTVVAPITSKRATRFLSSHVNLCPELQLLGDGFKNVTGTVCSEQIRTVNKSRLKSLVGCLNHEGIEKVNKAIVAMMDLNMEVRTAMENQNVTIY